MDYADFEIAKQQSDKNIKWGTFGVIPNVYLSFKITKQLRNGMLSAKWAENFEGQLINMVMRILYLAGNLVEIGNFLLPII